MNNNFLRAIRHVQRTRYIKRASLCKSAVDFGDRFVKDVTGESTTSGAVPKVGGPSPDINAGAHYGAKMDTPQDIQERERIKNMKYLSPGVYQINTGILPLPGIGPGVGKFGLSDFLRHSLVATVHDKKPNVPDGYQLPNGQWVTYFTSNPTSKLPWVGGENLPVWNGHYNKGGVWDTKADWHKDNEHVLNAMVDPSYRIQFGPFSLNPKDLQIDYNQVASGEEAANDAANRLMQLYNTNKYRTFGPYSYGLFTPANNCVPAAAFGLSNLGLSPENYKDFGGGFTIPAEEIDNYKHLGVVPGNRFTTNPAPPPLINITGESWEQNTEPTTSASATPSISKASIPPISTNVPSYRSGASGSW